MILPLPHPIYVCATVASANGTYLNGAKLQKHKEVQCFNGDRVSLCLPPGRRKAAEYGVFRLQLLGAPVAGGGAYIYI